MDVLLVSKHGEICRETSDELLGVLASQTSGCSSVSNSVETNVFPPLCPVGGKRVRHRTPTPETVSLPDAIDVVAQSNRTENNNNLEFSEKGRGVKSAQDHKRTSVSAKNTHEKSPNGNTGQNGRNCKSSKDHVDDKNGRQSVDFNVEKSKRHRRRRSTWKTVQDAERFKAGVYRQFVGRRHAFDLGNVTRTSKNYCTSETIGKSKKRRPKIDSKTESAQSSTTEDPLGSCNPTGSVPATIPEIAVDNIIPKIPPRRKSLSPQVLSTLGRGTRRLSVAIGLDPLNSSRPHRKGLNATMDLTLEQIRAFREVFDLFDSNGGGTIDADELDATLRSVDICLKADEIEEVLTVIDKDGNGEIDFQEFLQLMTNTKRFLQTLSHTEERQTVNREGLLFEALTEFMKKSALHSMDEIVGYYHTKYKRVQTPHVVNHYAAGARLIGLNEKQLREHLERLKAATTPATQRLQSPYAQPLHIVTSTTKTNTLINNESKEESKKCKTGVIRLKVNLNISSETDSEDNKPSGKGDTGLRGLAPKPKGWMSQRMEHIEVQLPPAHLKDLQPFDELTAEDLPNIRSHVTAACKEYTSGRRKSQFNKNLRHWKQLDTPQITPPVLRDYFRTVFSVYAAVNQAMLSP